MELILCSVNDKKVGFRNIFMTDNIGQAIRTFGDVVKSEQSEYGKHPEDFDLYKVGKINTGTEIFNEKSKEYEQKIMLGNIKGEEPILIARATEFIKKEEESK